MARYRLIGKHYLAVEGSEWEQVEVNLLNGRQMRHRYKVPRYLDVSDSSDHNYPDEIIISTKADPAFPRDYIVDMKYPNLDVEPLDDEARTLLEKVQAMGSDPIESLPSNGQTFSEVLLEKLTRQLDTLTTRQGIPQAASTDRVSELEKQIEELKAMIMGKTIAEDKVEYEPLPELPLEPAKPQSLSIGAK